MSKKHTLIERIAEKLAILIILGVEDGIVPKVLQLLTKLLTQIGFYTL